MYTVYMHRTESTWMVRFIWVDMCVCVSAYMPRNVFPLLHTSSVRHWTQTFTRNAKDPFCSLFLLMQNSLVCVVFRTFIELFW